MPMETLQNNPILNNGSNEHPFLHRKNIFNIQLSHVDTFNYQPSIYWNVDELTQKKNAIFHSKDAYFGAYFIFNVNRQSLVFSRRTVCRKWRETMDYSQSVTRSTDVRRQRWWHRPLQTVQTINNIWWLQYDWDFCVSFMMCSKSIDVLSRTLQNQLFWLRNFVLSDSDSNSGGVEVRIGFRSLV